MDTDAITRAIVALSEGSSEILDETHHAAILAGLASDDDDLAELTLEVTALYIDDPLGVQLLDLLEDRSASELARARAAVAFGPSMEEIDLFEDDPTMLGLSTDVAQRLERVLEARYRDTKESELVRRRAFEASVRAPKPWHSESIEDLWKSPDLAWRMTALFAMGYIGGFEEELVGALQDSDERVVHEAIVGVRNAHVKDAGSRLLELAQDDKAAVPLRADALLVAAELNAEHAEDVIRRLVDHNDQDLAEAAEEALEELVSARAIEELEADLDDQVWDD